MRARAVKIIISILLAFAVYGAVGLYLFMHWAHPTCAFARVMEGPDYAVNTLQDTASVAAIEVIGLEVVAGDPHQLETVIARITPTDQWPGAPDRMVLSGDNGCYAVPIQTRLRGTEITEEMYASEGISETPPVYFKANVARAALNPGSYQVGFELEGATGKYIMWTNSTVDAVIS